MGVEDFYDEEYLNEEAVKVTISFLFLTYMLTAAPSAAKLNISVIPAGSLCRHTKKTLRLKTNAMPSVWKTIR